MGATSKIEWCDIPNYFGYKVNIVGQIMGPSKKILKPMKNKSGHLYVLVPLPRRPRKLFIHRAVLFAFIGEPNINQECRHLDGNPQNNNLNNLKWGTRIKQREDERIHGTRCIGEKSGSAKLNKHKVELIRKLYPFYVSRQLAAMFDVSHTTILACINRHHWRNIK
ncbi:MAG: HNH endonuclease [Bacteroidetes bacterium]|nr:HNH endonuclease [Bacteroidota bacterium]